MQGTGKGNGITDGSVGGCFVFTVYCVDADGYFPDQAGKEKAPVELQTAGYDGPYPFGI